MTQLSSSELDSVSVSLGSGGGSAKLVVEGLQLAQDLSLLDSQIVE